MVKILVLCIYCGFDGQNETDGKKGEKNLETMHHKWGKKKHRSGLSTLNFIGGGGGDPGASSRK